MDPVSTAIIVALTEAGKELIGDAYKTLKAALQKKCGVDSSLVEAMEHLEKKPEAKARQTGVEEEVKAAKADQDPEILAAAQELLAKAKAQPGGVEWGGVAIVDDGNIVDAAPRPPIPLQRPPRAAHFTGRKDELARLLADLQPGRVVSLCGPDGIGKTTLAAEAAWTLAPHQDEPPDRFPDGVIFHTFYGQPDPALALEHIVRSFGEEPKPTPAEAALRVLAGRQALLILDGTEEVKNLGEVQRVTGGCGVLVTSRDRADAPDPTQRRDVQPLPLAEAVQLLQMARPFNPISLCLPAAGRSGATAANSGSQPDRG